MELHLIAFDHNQLGLLAPAVPPQLINNCIGLISSPQFEDALAAAGHSLFDRYEIVSVLAHHQFSIFTVKVRFPCQS